MSNLSSQHSLTDAEAVVLATQHPDNFAVIIERYSAPLLRYLKRLTNWPEEDLEDLLQDIFLKTYLNLNSYDSSKQFSSWIYALAHNQVISLYRKRQARPEGHKVDLEEADWQKLKADIDLFLELDVKDKQMFVEQVLEVLPVKYREVLVLKFLEDRSYQEISDIIKKPAGTVASLISRAKKEFKKIALKQNKKYEPR